MLLPEDRGRAFGADSAIVRLLEARGLRQATDAEYRVEVALASSDTGMSLDGGGRRGQLPSLCKRRRYALSVAMIDRRNGNVLFRRNAETRRCGTLSAGLVDGLAKAALGT